MKQVVAFTKKEFMELTRSGKLYLLIGIFFIFGIMNPALAKLTPYLFEMLSESLKEQGIMVMEVSVTAMTSWEQYYKNISMEFIVFVIMFCGIFTSEYQKGTLINVLTKGLSRWKVVLSKSITMILTWTLCYWLCFGVTYVYNAYFWDNSIAQNIFFAASASYLFGILLIAIIVLASSFMKTSSSVLLFTGGTYLVIYLLNMVAKLSKYLPIKLTSGLELLKEVSLVSDYGLSILVTMILIVLSFILAIINFNRRKL